MPDILGAVGAALLVGLYLLLQLEKVDFRSPVYSAGNAIGAALILLSLYHDFNLGAAVIEGFWLLASFVGLYRHRRSSRDKQPTVTRIASDIESM